MLCGISGCYFSQEGTGGGGWAWKFLTRIEYVLLLYGGGFCVGVMMDCLCVSLG